MKSSWEYLYDITRKYPDESCKNKVMIVQTAVDIFTGQQIKQIPFL